MQKLGLVVVIAVLACLLAVAPAGADPLVVMTENWPPFNYKNEKGKLTGYCTEIVREILKKTDRPDTIRLLPWSRAYDLALTRKNHALFAVDQSPNREKLFRWVGPLMRTTVYCWAKKGRPLKVATLADLKNVDSIAVQQDSSVHQILTRKGFGENLVTVTAATGTGHNVIKMLQFDRVALAIFSDISHNEQIRQGRVAPGELVPVYRFYSQGVSIAFNRETSPEIVKRWQKELDEIRQGPLIKALRLKYGLDHSKPISTDSDPMGM